MNIAELTCRCCLNKDCEVKNLFTEIDENFNLTLYSEFEEITNVQIDEKNDIIQHICLLCLHDLKISFRFRKQCLQSEINLKENFKEEVIEGYKIEEDVIIEEFPEEITEEEFPEVINEEEIITDVVPVALRRSTGRIRKKKYNYFSDDQEEEITGDEIDNYFEDDDHESDEEIPLSEIVIKQEKDEESDSSVDVKDKKYECQQCKKVYSKFDLIFVNFTLYYWSIDDNMVILSKHRKYD